MGSEPDKENAEKILEAAQQIERMAETKPEQASELRERARFLAELAEQIRQDWQNRFATVSATGETRRAEDLRATARNIAEAEAEPSVLQGVF